ncbi:hypothetical protein FHG87_005322 [Trinorchestia longiramus]|nr:hypothetical protein FHG87_005322 [Trinorchestia longiramus]
MKCFAVVALVMVLIAAVNAGMFGAGGAFKKKFPGAKPMSYEQYLQIQRQPTRRKQPSRPSSNWMFDTPAQVGGGHGGRVGVVRKPVRSWLNRSPGYFAKSDFSREDD